jgi:hypothetical protein
LGPKAADPNATVRSAAATEGQRALIQPGRAGEKRRANADESAIAFGGAVGGCNAPIKNAARTPSNKPKIILSAFGRMT